MAGYGIVLPVPPMREDVFESKARGHIVGKIHCVYMDERFPVVLENSCEVLESLGQITDVLKDANRENFVEFATEVHVIDVPLHQGETVRAQVACRIVHLATYIFALSMTQIQPCHSCVGESREDEIAGCTPPTSKIMNVIAIFNFKPFNQLIHHLKL